MKACVFQKHLKPAEHSGQHPGESVVDFSVWNWRTMRSHSEPHYYLTSKKIRETGMEMYGSVQATETPINQINRCAWDYEFINEAMDL